MRRLALLLPLLALSASAQISFGGPKVAYTATPETDGTAAGGKLRALFTFTLSEGWHVNAHKPLEDFLIPTELKMEPAADVTVSAAAYPEAKNFKTKFQEHPLAVYSEKFNIGLAIDVAAGAATGPRTLKGKLHYQACNDQQCSPPKDVPVELSFQVLPAGQAPKQNDTAALNSLAWDNAAPNAPTPAPEPVKAPIPTAAADSGDWKVLIKEFTVAGTAGLSSVDEFVQFIDDPANGGNRKSALEGRGFLGILLAVLVGGFLLNLTPCVLPLIPINLAILGAGARAGSKARGLALGGVYGAGIALVYGGLGLLVVLGVSTAFSTINSTVWFNVGIAALFVVLGLAMFDVIMIDFSRFQARFGIRKNEKGSLSVAFAMGALSALLAGACVAPILISTLLYAQDQYAHGNAPALALPFVLGLGMAIPWPFAGAGMSFLPKPGGWMDWVKKGLGVFILLLACFYLHTAWSIYQSNNVDPKAVTASANEAAEHGWQTNLAAGLAQAKAEHKPVLLDFWATWCKNCLLMNEHVLKNEGVLKKLENHVKIQFQAENPDAPATKEVWDHFKLVGLPTYIILNPK